MRVHIIKKQLVILELMIPFGAFRVAKIVSQRGQDHRGTEELWLLSVLVQKHLGPAKGEGAPLTPAGPLATKPQKNRASCVLPVFSLARFTRQIILNYYTDFYYPSKILINSYQRENPIAFPWNILREIKAYDSFGINSWGHQCPPKG